MLKARATPIKQKDFLALMRFPEEWDSLGMYADLAPFPVRLVAGHEPSSSDWINLRAMLLAYQKAGRAPATLSILESYLEQQPRSPWALSIRLNQGRRR